MIADLGGYQKTKNVNGINDSDIQAFRELFKRISGMTPNEYRMKYKKFSGTTVDR